MELLKGSTSFQLKENKTEICINETGVYRVLCNVTTYTDGCYINLRVDGSTIARARDEDYGKYYQMTTICELIRITAGQKLSVLVNGGKVNSELCNSLSLERVG